jgi:hypothetical protein
MKPITDCILSIIHKLIVIRFAKIKYKSKYVIVQKDIFTRFTEKG